MFHDIRLNKPITNLDKNSDLQAYMAKYNIFYFWKFNRTMLFISVVYESDLQKDRNRIISCLSIS